MLCRVSTVIHPSKSSLTGSHHYKLLLCCQTLLKPTEAYYKIYWRSWNFQRYQIRHTRHQKYFHLKEWRSSTSLWFDIFTQCKHQIASIKTWNKLIQNIYTDEDETMFQQPWSYLTGNKKGKLYVVGLMYSPAGTQSAVRRPPVCRRLPRVRSVPSRTAETHLARPPSRPHVLPTTSPACPASRSHSSASWCPACPGRPPAHACPAETHNQCTYMSLSVVKWCGSCFFWCQQYRTNVSWPQRGKKNCTLHVLLPGKNVNTESSVTGKHGGTHSHMCMCGCWWFSEENHVDWSVWEVSTNTDRH